MTNTQIKPVTKYEVNGQLFDTEELAQQYLNKLELMRFFINDDLHFNGHSSDEEDIAGYCIANKERLIHLLSFIK